MKPVVMTLTLLMVYIGCFAQKQQQKEYWVETYKNIVAMAAMKQAVPNIDSNDASSSINFDLIGSDAFAAEADSVGKAFFRTLVPPAIYRDQGLKAVLNNTLHFYDSKELDKIAKAAYRRFKASQKQYE